MTRYKTKFFGARQRKEQLKQMRMNIEARNGEEVEEVLRHRYGYEIIHGLKITKIEE